jgi:rhodanese-related sulfurtransferase
MQEISAKELKERLDGGEDQALLLDVREPWEFEICHIPGAILIPMGDVEEKLDELDPEREIVVICHHGIRSQQVAYYLEQVGFGNVTNLSGGVAEWAAEVDPAMPTY